MCSPAAGRSVATPQAGPLGSMMETKYEACAATIRGRLTRNLGSRMVSAGCHRTGCHSEASDWPGFCSWCLSFLLIGAWPVGYVLCAQSAGWMSESRQWTVPEKTGRRCRSAQSRSNLTCPLTSLQQSHQGLRGPHPFLLHLCAPLHLPPLLWSHPGCSALSGNWACDWTGEGRETESQDSPHGSSEERREEEQQTKDTEGKRERKSVMKMRARVNVEKKDERHNVT